MKELNLSEEDRELLKKQISEAVPYKPDSPQMHADSFEAMIKTNYIVTRANSALAQALLEQDDREKAARANK